MCKKYFLIYKITNNINNKIYIGSHITNNINDDYFGSGKLIKSAIKKYGKHNFSKIILSSHESEIEMYKEESTIVNEEFIKRTDTYNLNCGGYSGWTYLNSTNQNGFKTWTWSGKTQSKEHKEKRLEKIKGVKLTDERKLKISNTRKQLHSLGLLNTVKGNNLSDSHKLALSNSAKLRKKIQCQYCNKTMDSSNYHRWHGKKCKENKL